MVWVALDDKALSHPKQLSAGVEGVALWVAGLCHCNAHNTNGKVAKNLITMLYPPLGNKALKAAQRLVEVRLWDDCGDHYLVHDYEHFQAEALKDVVEHKRTLARDRKRKQRERERDESSPVTRDKRDDKRDENSVSHALVTRDSPARVGTRDPVPTRPDPSRSDPESEPETSVGVTADMWHVFNRWVEIWGKKLPATKFTPKRKRVVRERLKKYSLAELIEAIEGAHMSPHHRGQNESGEVYDDLELHLRSDEHLEKHRDRKRRGGNVMPIKVANGNGRGVSAPVATREELAADAAGGPLPWERT